MVRGHPRSSETSPFDGALMTSYSTLIETMCLSCTAILKTLNTISSQSFTVCSEISYADVHWPCQPDWLLKI